MYQIQIHRATDLRVSIRNPSNANCIVLEVTAGHGGISKQGDYTVVSTTEKISLFGLPCRITDALQWALGGRDQSDRDRTEALAERIANAIADTHDIDVTDETYGLAVAADLLGTDLTAIHLERREERRKAKEAAA